MSVSADAGSFRDEMNRVYFGNQTVFRGLNAKSFDNFQKLETEQFYKKLVSAGKVIASTAADEQQAATVFADGWIHVLEHPKIPFISYPYEWSFGMLKQAALLQLDIITIAMSNGWTLKDATPYNIQWQGTQPVFIDVGSFEPWQAGAPWVGYRQFCSLFLYPLLLKSHLNVDFRPMLRSMLDGIDPGMMRGMFNGRSVLKRGIPIHVILANAIEQRFLQKGHQVKSANQQPNHSKAMILGTLHGLSKLIESLCLPKTKTVWSDYEKEHSYNDTEIIEKTAFIDNVLQKRSWQSIWDLGCNSGHFSRIAAAYCEHIISVDGDAEAIELLFERERAKGGMKILPLIANLANLSPNQGWNGKERTAFDKRGKPDLVLVLAVIHHMRVSSSVPISMFFDWLHSLGSEVIIEFVDRHDEMFETLIQNRTAEYADYSLSNFVSEAEKRFNIAGQTPLKGGKRQIFHLVPL